MSIKESLPKLKQADLMALFNVSDRTIQLWHAKGLPRNGQGRGHTYVWEQVLPWYVAYVSGSADGRKTGQDLPDRERKLKADADISEMDAAEQAGDLVKAVEVRAVWNAFLSRMNSAMDGYPDRAAEQISDYQVLAERVAILRKEMNIMRRDIVAETRRMSEQA